MREELLLIEWQEKAPDLNFKTWLMNEVERLTKERDKLDEAGGELYRLLAAMRPGMEVAIPQNTLLGISALMVVDTAMSAWLAAHPAKPISQKQTICACACGCTELATTVDVMGLSVCEGCARLSL